MNINIDLVYLGYAMYDNHKYDVVYALGFDGNELGLCSDKWDKKKKDKCGIVSYNGYFYME